VLSARKIKRDSLLWNLALYSKVERKTAAGSAGAAAGLVFGDGLRNLNLQTAGMRSVGVSATSTQDYNKLASCSHCGT
jgi:hypothetical protein